MKHPISKGDLCEVVGGLGRSKSPNLGLQVVVGQLQGEHSQHGMVWRCTGDGIQQLTDGGGYVVTGWADFPASWLRRIDDSTPPATESTKKELTA